MGIVAGVIGLIVASSCIGGMVLRSRARERRAQALRDLQYSLSSARNSYNYGSNTYGNTYGANRYGTTNTYGTTPTYGSTSPAYGVPAVPSFVTNSANRSMGEISAQIAARSASFRACAMSDPNARGQMAVRFMIGSQGNVLTSFAHAGGSSGSTTVDACVNAGVRTMYFARSTGLSIVVHPIQLR
jgi:hypothetical protein